MPYSDPIKQKEAQHKHYINNKKDYAGRVSDRRKIRKEWFRKIMETKSCHFCKENAPECLDWHHLVPEEKDDDISRLLNELRSLDRILNEMKKCIVLCANCHRKVHAGLLCVAQSG